LISVVHMNSSVCPSLSCIRVPGVTQSFMTF